MDRLRGNGQRVTLCSSVSLWFMLFFLEGYARDHRFYVAHLKDGIARIVDAYGWEKH